MTILTLAASLNDNQTSRSPCDPRRFATAEDRLPSEAVLAIMRTALQCLGPLGPNDAIILSRVLNRLFEIEHDDGVLVAVRRAKELVDLIQVQKRIAR